jgi:hypothetical protein
MKLFVAFAAGLLAFASPATAGSLAKPAGKVVLTVSGSIETKNAGEDATFDMSMLDALPQRKTVIETPWTTGKVAFEGPLASAFLDAVGARGTKVMVTALNDYTAEIPLEDFRKWPVILATKMDGKPMPVREKGPIFVIYPFDVDSSLYNEQYFGRSVWQVKAIEIR